MNTTSNPREITAKFNSLCAETGKRIKRGDRCVYYPSQRKVYHPDSVTAQSFRQSQWSKANYMADANW